jgi:hypothetical protein
MRAGLGPANFFWTEGEGKVMKRLLAFALALASFGFVASTAEAKTAGTAVSAGVNISASAPEPQWQNSRRRSRWNRRWNRRWNHRGGVRVTTETRFVRFGRRLFRETYQVRTLPNGRSRVTLISRVRVR